MTRAQVARVRCKLTAMAADESNAAPGPSTASAEPTHSEDGVDLTLIRWMLSLTPAERLTVLQENVRGTTLMLEGYRVPEFPRLIRVKAQTPRERDLKILAILQRTLEEKSRK